MPSQNYKTRRKELEREQRDLESSLRKVRAKLTALDIVWPPESSPSDGVVSNSDDSTPKEIVVNGRAQLLIDEAVSSMDREFGVKEIEACIHQRHPDVKAKRTTIAGRLRKLVDDGKLELVQPGIGRRPGKFRGRSAA